LTTSERQALAATVCVVELDIACGNTAAALQLGRPLALSLRHLGRRETRFELLVLIFSAMLLAGETAEARATGAELYEMGLRIDRGRLYTALDAMALLACQDGRHEAAARIAACSDVTHEVHGTVRRRPAEEKVRAAALKVLNERLGAEWRAQAACQPLNEEEACAIALGIR
jgi:hypothetical protein